MLENLFKNIKEAFVNNKKILLGTAIIFFSSIVLGFILGPYLHSIFNPVVEEIANELHKGTITVSFHDIFLNNIKVLFIMYCLGLFCCISIVSLLYNGFFVGYFMSTGDIYRYLVLIIPHGIFEFTSCIIGTAAGFLLFKYLIKILKSISNYSNDLDFSQKVKKSFLDNVSIFKESIILFIVAVILMMIAAFIESNITLNLGNWIFSNF